MKKLNYILSRLGSDFWNKDSFVGSYVSMSEQSRLLMYAAVRIAEGSFKNFFDIILYARNIVLLVGTSELLDGALCCRQDLMTPLRERLTYIVDLDSGIPYYVFHYDEEETKNDDN